jgi:hypothetical protein
VSADAWGKRPKKQKGKRDGWSKPKRGRRKTEFGAVPKAQKKKDKAWGKEPKKDSGKGVFDAVKVKRGGWLSKWMRPERVSLVRYYHKLDQLQAHEIQAGVREQLAERYQSEIDNAETIGTKLQRWAEGILRRRLSPGQMNDVKDVAKEVVSPNRVIAFVTNLFK